MKSIPASAYSIEESISEVKNACFSTNKPISTEYTNQFPLWAKYLNNGLNLCLFGIGSKARVAEAFVDSHFPDHLKVKIRGSNGSVKAEGILMKLLQAVEPFTNLAHSKRINKILSTRRHKAEEIIDILIELFTEMEKFGVYLLVLFHDIDGKNFRELEAHEALSKLFVSPLIRLVATLTSSNFGPLLSGSVLMRYNFCFQQVHTFEPNESELMADELSWFNQKETKGTSAIKIIYAALTESQKEILKLLAAKISESSTGQILFSDFYDHCLDEMIVSSEAQLSECLKEAISHAVLVRKADCDREDHRRQAKGSEDAQRGRGPSNILSRE